MTTTDLSSYSLSDLKGLQHEIDKAIVNRRQQEMREAREQILAIAQNLGVPVEELVTSSAKKVKSEKGEKVDPKYQNPADSSQTWTGRGRQPKWIVDALATGQKLDDLRI